MRNRPLHLLALGGLAVALVLAARHTPANQPPATTAATQPAKESPPAPPAIKVNASKVTAVTVYPVGALVTREVEATGPAGRVELVVSPLPAATISSSLYAEGTDGIRVLTTRYRTRPIIADTTADVKKAMEELKALQIAKEKIDGDLGAIQENVKMLGKMEGFLTVTTVQATEKGALNADAAIALAKHIREQRIETAKEVVNLKQQLMANQEKAELVQHRLQGLVNGISRYEHDAIIVVDKANAAAGTIRLNYLVDNASWSPQYKLRADKAGKEQVTLEYLAGIVQDTGEEWPNVKLVLSTAQPMLNSAPPDLQSLHVSVAPKGAAAGAQPTIAELEDQIKSLRNKAQKDFNDRKAASGAGLVNTAAAREQSWELFNPEAAVKRGCMLSYREGPTVTYRIATPLTVASRPDAQVLEVAKIDLKPDFYYKTVPILSPHVYRMAEMVNKSEHVLLPGEATMYSGSDFVGQMTLPLVAVGEQFTVGFGVDPQLVVQRSMVDKMRSTSGGNQLLRYDYRILVNSYKTEKVKLQVWDRLPYAENDTVGVSLLKTSPELSKDPVYQREQRPNNLLRWDVTVEANAHGEKALAITFEFKLELDRQFTIGGFQTAGVSGTHPGLVSAPLPPISAADQVKMRAMLDKLPPEDRRLAETQVFCAIDQDSPLGTMGPILKVNVKGQPVFVCCKGCEAEAKTHPDETLLQFQQLMKRVNARK
jgi:uncharacterized protein (TIGR02231 family)